MNYIYLGDCHNVLKNEIADESVDLIYIDPPFNSKRDYNIFFDSKEIQTQRIAFEDTWTLTNIQDSLAELNTIQTHNLYKLLTTYQEVAPHAFPYLVMMGLRILELHRVLKPTGSFYLHCDPTMSHYLKTICDLIFKPKNFLNEIVWCYRGGGRSNTDFARKHDIIFRFSKSSEYTFNPDPIKIPYEARDYGKDHNSVWGKHKGVEKIYMPKVDGKIPEDWWNFDQLNSGAKERLGYPTQKPRVILERIIQASSNEGDTVLDAFCGCGTSIDAAEGLHRKWIGIDISPIAISLIKRRLKDAYKTSLSKFEVRGVPEDEQSAIKLWNENPNAFQDWWLTEFEVFSTTEGTKGADKGIDGIGQYLIGEDQTIRVAFQVKGGKVQSKDIDALIGVLSKHKCDLGVFLTIEPPTKPMLETATGEGFVEYPGFQYPKIQIHTLKEFFANKRPKLPKTNITFKSAQFKGKKSKQIDLGI